MNKYEDNVFFLADFDDGMESEIVVPLTREIQRQRRLREGRIDLYINSFGGYAHLVFQLVSLVEIAKRDKIVVRTIVPDIALSAGSILAVTGTPGERYIEKEARHLLHYGSAGTHDSTPEQHERDYLRIKGHFDRIARHYERYARVPDLREYMKDDNFYVPGKKAIQYGLADRFMEKFDIGWE